MADLGRVPVTTPSHTEIGRRFGSVTPVPQRTDGYLAIEDYAVIGDGRTVALVGRDGSIDWWPAPDVDSAPLAAALLDAERGGQVVVRPTEPYRVERRYLPGTIVVETTFTTDTGQVRLVDSLNVGGTGRLPWTELARRIEGVSGTVTLTWEVAPGTNFGARSPWTTGRDGRLVVHAGSHHMHVATTANLGAERRRHSVAGTAEIVAGERATLGVVVTEAAPVPLVDPADVARRAELTVAGWEAWSGTLTCEGSWDEAVRRSALTLKLLIHAPGGAIVAAPTTSLPEQRGGEKNWDYRFAWVRDSSFTIDALIRLGLHEEVHGAMAWLLRAVRSSDPQLEVFYTVHGRPADGQEILAAPGWRGHAPVRSGNRATGQRQLGTFGDLFGAVHSYVERGYVLDPATGRLLERLADWCCDAWGNPDAGIWELQEDRHFTWSKMGCWAALDCAVHLATDGHVPDRHRERWTAERDEIRALVEERCWSDELGCYTAAADSTDLDASVLLAGRFGFDRGKRLSATIDAIRSQLGHGALLRRAGTITDEDGAFVACSFWMATALVHVGRLEEARHVLDEMVGHANDVGLYAEMVDPSDGSFLGNFPQGLSHLALVEAVYAYRQAVEAGAGGDRG